MGFFVNSRLPEKHRSREFDRTRAACDRLARDLYRDRPRAPDDFGQVRLRCRVQRSRILAGQLAQLDRCLRDYGPETQRTREQLRSYVAAIIASTWPSEPPPTGVTYPDTSHMPRTGESTVLADLMNEIGLEIQTLQPTNSLHRNLMSSCAAQYADLLRLRWTVIEGIHASISAPFYWVLVFWLLILFGSFGLRAPPNTLSIIVIALCAISVTSAIFVILDMDIPYGGLFGIPSTSMRNALADMMR